MEVVKPLKVMVEEFSPPILPLLLALLLLLLLVHQLRQPRLPPGVPRLPLLGSVPWLIASGKKMMELVSKDNPTGFRTLLFFEENIQCSKLPKMLF